MKYVFDTTILVDHLRNVKEAKYLVQKVERGEIDGIISVITEAELLSAKRCERKEEREMIEELLKIFRKVELTNKIGKKASEFRRKYGASLLDCIIAATAFEEKCRVLTLNLKDFQKIEEIEVEKPY